VFATIPVKRGKVFWFFFSKKNFWLCLLPIWQWCAGDLVGNWLALIAGVGCAVRRMPGRRERGPAIRLPA
jgi:hypothetical protein